MGKGDIRSRRGKLFRGTFGKTRPDKKKKNQVPAAPVETPATEPTKRRTSKARKTASS